MDYSWPVPHPSRSEGWGTDGCLKRLGLSNPSPTLSFGKDGAQAQPTDDHGQAAACPCHPPGSSMDHNWRRFTRLTPGRGLWLARSSGNPAFGWAVFGGRLKRPKTPKVLVTQRFWGYNDGEPSGGGAAVLLQSPLLESRTSAKVRGTCAARSSPPLNLEYRQDAH